MLPKIGAELGLIAPVLIMLSHIGLAIWGVMAIVRLKRGVYRATAGWILAILVLPRIDVLIEPLFASSDAEPWFVLPDYLPFLNEQPELLISSLILLCLMIVAIRRGRRDMRMPTSWTSAIAAL